MTTIKKEPPQSINDFNQFINWYKVMAESKNIEAQDMFSKIYFSNKFMQRIFFSMSKKGDLVLGFDLNANLSFLKNAEYFNFIDNQVILHVVFNGFNNESIKIDFIIKVDKSLSILLLNNDELIVCNYFFIEDKIKIKRIKKLKKPA